MPLPRVLEPELMDTLADALDYNEMDHAAVNRCFVTDLLSAAPELVAVPQADELAAPIVPPMGPGLFSFPLPGPAPLEVLDLGTGTALIPIELCRTAENCRVIAVDAAPSMLEIAGYNLQLAQMNQRIILDLVDAKGLKFADERFPVVMSNSIVHHIPQPLSALQEAVRVTAPGGLLFFRDLFRPDTNERVIELVSQYAAGANDHQRKLLEDSFHAALSLDEIRALVEGLGFAPETVQATSDRHWTWCVRKADPAANISKRLA